MSNNEIERKLKKKIENESKGDEDEADPLEDEDVSPIRW